jgi:hypothetical protein
MDSKLCATLLLFILIFPASGITIKEYAKTSLEHQITEYRLRQWGYEAALKHSDEFFQDFWGAQCAIQGTSMWTARLLDRMVEKVREDPDLMQKFGELFDEYADSSGDIMGNPGGTTGESYIKRAKIDVMENEASWENVGSRLAYYYWMMQKSYVEFLAKLYKNAAEGLS